MFLIYSLPGMILLVLIVLVFEEKLTNVDLLCFTVDYPHLEERPDTIFHKGTESRVTSI